MPLLPPAFNPIKFIMAMSSLLTVLLDSAMKNVNSNNALPCTISLQSARRNVSTEARHQTASASVMLDTREATAAVSPYYSIVQH
jgi:hypothetical protein